MTGWLQKAPFPWLMVILALLTAACGTPAGKTTGVGSGLIAASDIGYVLVDLETGQELASEDADRGFIPASTAKTPTMVAALGILGPEYRFTTSVHVTGRLQDGRLDGDLVLRGGGDPLLTVQDLSALVQRLHDGGLRSVGGRFVYDETFLLSVPEIAPNQPEAAGYNPGVSALSLDFNRIHVPWRSVIGKATMTGAPVPATGLADLTAATQDTGPGQPFRYDGGESGERWRVAAHRLPDTDGRTALPVKYPALRTALVFRELSGQLGIDLPHPEPGRLPTNAAVAVQLKSLPLIDIVRLGLEFSNNLVSELIGLTAARQLSGRDTSLDASSQELQGWLGAKMPNTDWRGYDVPNHSGLAASARVTPRQMVAVLKFAWRNRYGGWSFASLLPMSGWRDAFGGRFADRGDESRVRAKTGTMHFAKGLAGFLHTSAGRKLAFALFITDFEKRRRYDANRRRLAPESQASAKAWIAAAEAKEESLVRDWISRY